VAARLDGAESTAPSSPPPLEQPATSTPIDTATASIALDVFCVDRIIVGL
jgi:hypothetical protein